MKTKPCKVFLLISVVFMLITIILAPQLKDVAAEEVPKTPITKQNPEKPCLKVQQRAILDKLEHLEEELRIDN